MNRLKENSPVLFFNLENIPKRGIYVFYEKGRPIYVGRSRNLKQRFRQHKQQSSDHHSATFAFMIALQDAEKAGIEMKKDGKKMTRDVLQKDPAFRKIFSDAKRRVAGMQVQVISIDDPIEQTLFEVYAALELNTEYNHWDTH
jgi:predicted GIY-YIG superfamily endonuclease